MARQKLATAAAVRLVHQGMTKYAAAKECGVSQSTVRRALERTACGPLCANCKRPIEPEPERTTDDAKRMIDAVVEGATP